MSGQASGLNVEDQHVTADSKTLNELLADNPQLAGSRIRELAAAELMKYPPPQFEVIRYEYLLIMALRRERDANRDVR